MNTLPQAYRALRAYSPHTPAATTLQTARADQDIDNQILRDCAATADSMSAHGVAVKPFEIRRAAGDAIDSAYATLAQAKGALDERDRAAPGTFYGISAESGERFYSFAEETRRFYFAC